MSNALKFITWPAIAGVLAALLILDRWVLPTAPDGRKGEQEPVSYARAVNKASPSVVNIYTAKLVTSRRNPLLDDRFFRRYSSPFPFLTKSKFTSFPQHPLQEVHYASARGGVSVVTEAGEVTRSALLVQRATLTDAGNYTCQPEGAASATARVHVIHGECHRERGDGGRGEELRTARRSKI